MLTERMVPPKLIEFICVNLCLSACICGKKKEFLGPADDKGLTLIHALVEKRDLISAVLTSTNWNFDDKFSALTGFREALQFAVVFFNDNLV